MKFLKNRGGKDMKESSGIKNKNKKKGSTTTISVQG
jgi:hypothetical protein